MIARREDPPVRANALPPSPEERTFEAANRALRSTGRWPLCNVDVHVIDDSVVLSGRVPTYHLKQLAQAIVLSLEGVRTVQNELDVDSVR